MLKDKKAFCLFLIPGLLSILIFYVIPFIVGLYYSFLSDGVDAHFIGLIKYQKIWANKLFQLGLKNSFIFTLICAPTVWILAFIVSSMLNNLKGGDVLKTSILIPYIMPSSAVIIIFLLIFDYGGIVNRLLVFMGIHKINFNDGATLRIPIVILFIWRNLGFAVLIYLSTMQSIPNSLFEHAKLEGAGFFRQTIYITLPHIIPTAFLVLVLEWISAFRIFKEIYFLAGAYPSYEVYTLQNYMNNMYNKLNYRNLSIAAYSFTFMLFVLFALLFFIQKRIMLSINGE